MHLRVLITGLVSVLLCLAALMAVANPPEGHLNIDQVMVDDPDDPTSITIIGSDFLFGPGSPTVTLGWYVDPLIIDGDPTNEEIVALLPDGILPGDYLLIVATGTGQSWDRATESSKCTRRRKRRPGRARHSRRRRATWTARTSRPRRRQR